MDFFKAYRRPPEHKGTVRLETKRLVLRRFRLSDAADMYSTWASDREVTKYLAWPPHDSILTTEQLLFEWEKNYEDPSYYNWAVCLKESGRPLGSVGVIDFIKDSNAMNVGYCIGKKFWNRGYMTEALSAAIRFLLDEVGINTVSAYHAVLNRASGRVMIKCGMRYQGRIAQYGRTGEGESVDVEAYKICKKRRLFCFHI